MSRINLEGEINQSGDKIYVDVFTKEDTHLGSIQLTTEPTKEDIEWANKIIKQKEDNG